jgi:hypothetical protein
MMLVSQNPLVSPLTHHHLPTMTRLKTRTLPLVAAIFASAVSQTTGQVDLSLRTEKTFRQHKSKVEFRDGQFRIDFGDGSANYQPGCFAWQYFFPSIPCPDGATGFIGFGNLDPELPDPPTYYLITSITPAIIVEPRNADLCLLNAAPASDLDRPAPGFIDKSYSLFYNIAPGSVSIREYFITIYEYQRTYQGIGGGKRMTGEIVPGVYHFSFPQLGDPNRPVAIPIVHYPIPEGYTKIGNVKQGVQFINLPGKFDKRGFMLFDKNKIQTITWAGLSSNLVYPSSDRLYFSVRNLVNPNNPRSNVRYENGQGVPISIFPAVVSGADPRVLLENALVSSYTMPPLVDTGTRGVIEVELVRNVSTNGVTYDRSSRRYQMPVRFVDQYEEFRKRAFGSSTGSIQILDDFDRDGYNNLTEWVLESRANDRTSIPRQPVPRLTQPVLFNDGTVFVPGNWGFTVFKRKGLIPGVRYSIERSRNGGRTWAPFTGDAYWNVTNTANQIRVQGPDIGEIFQELDPADLELPRSVANDTFRVKITLR